MINKYSLAAAVLFTTTRIGLGFAPGVIAPFSTTTSTSTSTSLYALGVLARKAKENEIRQWCESGIDDDTMEQVKIMKANLANAAPEEEVVGPVQSGLTKRKGTISIIAEYKRKFIVDDGFADEMFDPQVLSPTFREFGARGVAVMADERIGGCTYDDVLAFAKEQQTAKGDMPGPVPVISSDLIVDEVQIARSAAAGAEAVVVTYGVVGEEKVDLFLKCARAVGIEVIVAVSTKEEAQAAVDAGARIISVSGVDNVDERFAVIDGLNIPDSAAVCTIANILANDNKALEEVEEAWVCRDQGFNAVWVSDALYKSGNDPSEHAGAIIKGMAAKSSVKWASAKAMGGKGEGAREYLGDIMM
jgi:indole-3-glycerol phosphate synthase